MDAHEYKQKCKQKLHKLQKRLDAIRKSKNYLEKIHSSAHRRYPKVDTHSESSEMCDKEKLQAEIRQLRREQRRAEKLYFSYDRKLKDKYKQYKKYCKSVLDSHS